MPKTQQVTMRVRGSIWTHPSKKRGFGRSVGEYDSYKGKRHFFLVPVNGGARKRFANPGAARAAGWVKE